MMASPYVILLLLLVVGVALYGVGTMLVRSANGTAAGDGTIWTRQVIDAQDSLDVATRIDMIERLALIGEPWCFDILRAARSQERDARVRAATIAALSRENT